jgi:hypothetical protein
MKRIAPLLLFMSLVLVGCTPAEQPIPVEPDGGIGDGAEPLPVLEEEFVSLGCERIEYWLPGEDRVVNPEYEAWVALINETHDGQIYDVGSTCVTEDNHTIMSFVVFKDQAFSQKIIELDNLGAVVNETPDEVIVQTAGDMGAPVIESIEDGVLSFSFYHGDGPCRAEDHFELDLETFEYQKVDELRDCGEWDIEI